MIWILSNNGETLTGTDPHGVRSTREFRLPRLTTIETLNTLYHKGWAFVSEIDANNVICAECGCETSGHCHECQECATEFR